MKSNQRKNATRRKLTVTSRHDKFISTYLKAKHPEVFREADRFYTQLDERYPEKRDLRKTMEFLNITAAVTNINEHYYRNKLSKKLERNPNANKMVLEIPLLDQSTLTNNEEVNVHATTVIPEVNVHATPVIPEVNVHATAVIPEVNVHATAVIPEVNVHATPVIPEEVNESPLVIPDHVYEDLVRELTKDPGLKAIFDDMNDIDLSEEHQPVAEVENIIQESCQDPDTDMDEPTPLEWELYTLGY